MRQKQTYSGRRMGSIIFFNLVGDNTHTLKDLTKPSQVLITSAGTNQEESSAPEYLKP
jgi:hypothetical protein